MRLKIKQKILRHPDSLDKANGRETSPVSLSLRSAGSHQLCKLTRSRNALCLCGMTFPAFTLAEVLITLGIIGVVAAMTIPTVLQNVQEHSIVTALKKNYSMLSQAYTMAVQASGTPEQWDISANSDEIVNKLVPFLKVNKNCGSSANAGCFPTDDYKTLKGGLWYNFNTDTSYAKLSLADGTLIAGDGRMWSSSVNCYESCSCNIGSSPALQSVCGKYWIDINGYKKPNQMGVDSFVFYLTKNGIIPQGSQQQSGTGTFEATCTDKANHTGGGCAAWVIYNENMDYLKPCGTTLSWNGNTKCN